MAVNFYCGSEANYMAMATKDDNTLYFLEDTHRLFKGYNEYTKSMHLVDELPPVDEAAEGVLYIVQPSYATYICSGGVFQNIYKGYATTVPDTVYNHDSVPTTKAVADFVNEKFEEVTRIKQQYVSDVTYKNGILTVVENDEPLSTELSGVAFGATYDKIGQVLRIPMFGRDTLEVNFTQLSTIKSGQYNSETGDIDLVLANDEVVQIPVASMIDIYTGGPTQSTVTEIGANKQIKVKVKISEEPDNAIKLLNDGLYAYIPDGYTKAEVDSRVKAITDELENHIEDTVVHVTNAERAVWNSKVSSTQLAIAKAEAITTAEADAQNKADTALASAKAYTDQKTAELNYRLLSVEASLEWQTLED